MEHHILANAALFVEVKRDQLGVDATYDEAGVRWLAGYIDSQRDVLSAEKKAGLLNTAGSYLGECVRQSYGGRWVQDEQTGSWGAKVNERLTVFPFAKASKQLEGGEGDSILGMFTAIPHLMSCRQPPTSVRDSKQIAPSRPWWQFWRRGE